MSLRDLALAVWFLLWGLLTLTNFQFDSSNLIMGGLALVVAALTFYRPSPK